VLADFSVYLSELARKLGGVVINLADEQYEDLALGSIIVQTFVHRKQKAPPTISKNLQMMQIWCNFTSKKLCQDKVYLSRNQMMNG